MGEILVGTETDFEHDTRVFVQVGAAEVGVLRDRGEYYAFENRCAHQGGPVCEGIVIGRVETLLSADKEQVGQAFSEAEIHLVCPWHGWEYDIRTGVCAADPRFRLRRYDVVCRNGNVYLSDHADADRQSGAFGDG